MTLSVSPSRSPQPQGFHPWQTPQIHSYIRFCNIVSIYEGLKIISRNIDCEPRKFLTKFPVTITHPTQFLSTPGLLSLTLCTNSLHTSLASSSSLNILHLLLHHHSISISYRAQSIEFSSSLAALSASISLTIFPRWPNFPEYKFHLLHVWSITPAPSVSLSFLDLLSHTLFFTGRKNTMDRLPSTWSSSPPRDSPTLILCPFLITVVISLFATLFCSISEVQKLEGQKTAWKCMFLTQNRNLAELWLTLTQYLSFARSSLAPLSIDS